MSATARVVIPGMLRDLTDGVGEVAAPVDDDGSELSAVLDRAFAPWPRVASRVRDEQGRIRPHVNVFVDGEDAKRGEGLVTPVRPGSVVHVVNAVSGG
jgi:molybdopterin synthase sulfur carrier subunit